jgi:SAM-dependent methyltransferase
VPEPYDARYFTRCFSPPYGREDAWLTQFGRVADWLVAAVAPSKVLDAGCAMGLLVEALRDRGVEAYGIDVSEHALANVRADVAPFCSRRSIVDPFEERYDVITCIEVLEHLDPGDEAPALDNLCARTDVVLFSSTPLDFTEATHLNVQPPEHWATAFASRGFFRDFELDPTVATPWATIFRRQSAPLLRLVSGYERKLWHLAQDATGARAAFDGLRAEIREYEAAEASARIAEHAARVEADRAQAESAAQARAAEAARGDAATAKAAVDELRATRTFRYTQGARTLYGRARQAAARRKAR